MSWQRCLSMRAACAIVAITLSAVVASCSGGSNAGNGTSAVPYTSTDLRNAQSLGLEGEIAFVQLPAGANASAGQWDIYLIEPDGTHLRRLTRLAAKGDGAYFPHWSPDGKFLVFNWCSGGCLAPPPAKIGIVRSDGTNLRVLYRDPNPNNAAIMPSFAPDGRHVVFSHCTDTCRIARVNLDGTGLTTLSPPNPDGAALDFNGHYSPDGHSIIFDGYKRNGYLERLFIMNPDGSNAHPVSPPEIGANNAAWAADGRRVVFYSYPHFGGFGANEEIWEANASGGFLTDLTRLTRNNDSGALPYLQAYHDSVPSWSPNGHEIVFERDSPDFSSSSLELLKLEDRGFEATILSVRPALVAHAFEHASGIVMTPRSAFRSKVLRIIERGGLAPSWGPAESTR